MCTRAASSGMNGLPDMIDQPWIQGDNAMKRKTGRAGFTLIEMIVVIAIIAVLIALAAPLVTRYVATAKQARADAAAKSLCTAADAWLAEKMLGEHQSAENGVNIDDDGDGEFVKKLAGEAGPLDGYLTGGLPDIYTVFVENWGAAGAVCTMPDGTVGRYGN